ncbi:hypothetical protein ACQPZF_00985 [Actinosynnema sp. CS-041913]|uniref:hypothetical protein n=1 Tax=Actinosynnema sp. CS-041913 TaxID=3239917 RepID=UPI003D8C0E08
MHDNNTTLSLSAPVATATDIGTAPEPTTAVMANGGEGFTWKCGVCGLENSATLDRCSNCGKW